MSVVLLVAIVTVFWLAIFFGFHAANGTSFLDYLRGEYEPLPPDVGEWRKLETKDDSPLLEERVLFDEKNPGSFLLQRRTRDRATGAIVEAEPERRIPRKRLGRKGS